ncbi:hypothetical protein D3C83_132500 [compost metagenome]
MYSRMLIALIFSPTSLPTISHMRSNDMFSSWPLSALVAGVKIGSGSFCACLSPFGNWMPQIAPVAW